MPPKNLGASVLDADDDDLTITKTTHECEGNASNQMLLQCGTRVRVVELESV